MGGTAALRYPTPTFYVRRAAAGPGENVEIFMKGVLNRITRMVI